MSFWQWFAVAVGAGVALMVLAYVGVIVFAIVFGVRAAREAEREAEAGEKRHEELMKIWRGR